MLTPPSSSSYRRPRLETAKRDVSSHPDQHPPRVAQAGPSPTRTPPRSRRRRRGLPATGRSSRAPSAKPPACSPTTSTTRSVAPAAPTPPRSGSRPPPSRPTVTPASRSTSTATRSPSARPSAQVPSNPRRTLPPAPAGPSFNPAWAWPTPQQQRPRHRTPGPRRHPGRRQRRHRAHDPRLREPIGHRHDQPARPSRAPTATADRARTGASPHPQQGPRVRPLTPPHANTETAAGLRSAPGSLDPTTAGAISRPSADPRHPRGRQGSSGPPPTPVDDTTRGATTARSLARSPSRPGKSSAQASTGRPTAAPAHRRTHRLRPSPPRLCVRLSLSSRASPRREANVCDRDAHQTPNRSCARHIPSTVST